MDPGRLSLDSLNFDSEGKASACNAGDLGSFPGSGRSSGEGNCNPLQYLCPENPMDGGARWATVHGVTKSRTRLSDFTFPLCKLWVSTSVLRTSPTQNMGVLHNYCVSSLILMLLWELVIGNSPAKKYFDLFIIQSTSLSWVLSYIINRY